MIKPRKVLIDLRVVSCQKYGNGYVLLILKPTAGDLPSCLPGQFVEIRVGGDSGVLLRRPISINNIDNDHLWLLIKDAGAGTHQLCNSKEGDIYNVLMPLGKGFSYMEGDEEVMLCGGGVGVAPLLYWGKALKARGKNVRFLIGARSSADLLQIDLLSQYGKVDVATEDGTEGEKGLVTMHSAFNNQYSAIYCCGPMPMMKAVANIAAERKIPCEVSLENKMACGLGACLCCVEDTTTGNRCVCTDGPVFNISELKW